MRPWARYWLYFIVGDLVVTGISPGQPWAFYVVSSLVVSALAWALAGRPLP